MINENKSSCYPEIETYKQEVCSPYNELYIMLKKLNYISIFVLILISISCKNEKKNNGLNSNTESELKTDSLNGYNELVNPDKRETFTISEYNTDNPEIENIKRPEKTIIRNLTIDTTQAFGIWTQDPNGPHADFWFTAKDFLVADYDGDGHMPYILDGNKITIFYNDFVQKGTITSTENDTLKIKWAEFDFETKYVKFEN